MNCFESWRPHVSSYFFFWTMKFISLIIKFFFLTGLVSFRLSLVKNNVFLLPVLVLVLALHYGVFFVCFHCWILRLFPEKNKRNWFGWGTKQSFSGENKGQFGSVFILFNNFKFGRFRRAKKEAASLQSSFLEWLICFAFFLSQSTALLFFLHCGIWIAFFVFWLIRNNIRLFVLRWIPPVRPIPASDHADIIIIITEGGEGRLQYLLVHRFCHLLVFYTRSSSSFVFIAYSSSSMCSHDDL